MDARGFDELDGRIRGLIVALGPVLSPDEAAELSGLLDHAEFGEALHDLAWLIVEEKKRVPMAVVLAIEAIAEGMGTTAELPVTLSRHGGATSGTAAPRVNDMTMSEIE